MPEAMCGTTVPAGFSIVDSTQSLYGLVEVIDDTERKVRFLRVDHSVIGADLMPERTSAFAFVYLLELVRVMRADARSMLQLQLPSAHGEPVAAQVKALSVLVNADGRYFVDEHEVLRPDIDALKQTLQQVAGSDRSRPVLLRADARTPHQAVVTALDALGQLGFRKINIATAPEAKK